MNQANSLVLEVHKQDASLKMSIYEQRELSLTLRYYSQCAVSFPEIDKLCEEVTFSLNSQNAASLDADLNKGLVRIGQLLWEHLLTRRVKEKLKSARGADLVLSVDEELIGIPWELLHDGSDFLCLNFNLGRVVRTKEEAPLVQYRNFQSKVSMLILANPTNDLKSAYLEGINIRNQFDRKRGKVKIDFKSTVIDKLFVKRSLSDYDIVHFAGHCEYDEEDQKETGWVLSDSRFTVQDILSMGQAASLPGLIFSNACHSAKSGEAVVNSDYQQKSFSLAGAFLFSGVRHYIGAIRKIEDQVSLSFAREFYSHLLSGKSVGESIRLGRMLLIKRYGKEKLHWANYLVYGDPGFVLFRQAGSQSKLAVKRKLFSRKRFSYICGSVAVLALAAYLYMWLPSINPSTYYLFLKAKDLSRKGQNAQGILLGEAIARKESGFLAVYPLLAEIYKKTGDKEKALKYYFDYAGLSEKKNDKKSLAAGFLEIGWLYQGQGEFRKAFEFYEKALALAQEARSKLHEATALRRIAVWYIDKNDYAKALEFLTKSTEINRARNSYAHRYNLACDYFDIGLVFANKNDYQAARDFYNKSRLLFESLNLKEELSDCYFNLGEICLFEKEYQRAQQYYLLGLKIDEAQGNKLNLASDYNMVGELYIEMDRFKEAEESFNKAVAVSRELDSQCDLASSYYNLGLMYKKLGRINKSRENLRSAQEIYRAIGSSSYEEAKKALLDLTG